ncbi:MAG: FAD-dependent monooxygenase [Mycobacterium sp.]|nr:FAD-dependent monooxygenase [Mycobacterium sp.]
MPESGCFPTACASYAELGVADRVAEHAVPIDEFQFNRPDGSTASHQASTPDSHITMWGMYRPDIIDALAQSLPDGVLHTGHRCSSFRQDGHSAEVTFDNGVVVDADLVVGADGIHSALQPYVVDPLPPVFSGVVAYRGVVSASHVADWPWKQEFVEWAGAGKHLLVFPVSSGRLLNFVGFVPADDQMRESWSAPGDPDVLAAEFGGWDPWVQTLLGRVDSTFKWGLYDRDPLARWSNGRLVLLGDAAHAMLPHMGQGANQAIEDGMALATLIEGLGSGDLPDAVVRYQQLRRARTSFIQQNSRRDGVKADSGERTTPIARPGLQDYDVEAEARALR